MREAALRGSARAYYGLMSDAERDQVDLLLRRLETDPSADDVTTIDIPEMPNIRLLDDGMWRLLYSIPDEATVVILAISHALDLPQ